jgi:general secretion pathway protein D
MNGFRYLMHLTLVCALCILPSCAKKEITPKKRSFETRVLETAADIAQNPVIPATDSIPAAPELKIPVAAEQPETTDTSTQISASNDSSTQAKEDKTNPQLPKDYVLPKDELVEFYFENADLEQLVKQIEDLYDVKFITDEVISPAPPNARLIKGNKISFKTEKPLTKKEAWNLFNIFLGIAGFAVVPDPLNSVMRIVPIDTARRMPLPAFIGVPASSLPETDQIIRYVYFLENMSPDTLISIIGSDDKPGLRSNTSAFVMLNELKAFVITDKAYNIRSLMNIINELDRVTMPQSMSVIKLKRADAFEVAELLKKVTPEEDKGVTARLFPGRRLPTTQYFPENVRTIVEKRTNALILLGPPDALKKIEDFIAKYVDVDLTQPYSPLHVIQLKYANAATIQEIMEKVTAFGREGPNTAAQFGGVRNGDKFFKPMGFTAEPETNRLVVRGDYEDFLKVKDIINKLDSPQPQVAIEVLILAISLNDTKELGAQIRNRVPGAEGLIGYNAAFQTSGLFAGQNPSGIIQNPTTAGAGVNRLLGNLLNLVTNAPAGNTIISLGDSLSVWAILQALETISNTQVVANPFVFATNKTTATVSIGEIRRLITSQIISNAVVDAFGDESAKLEIIVTPQINSDGMIVLDLKVELSNFTSPLNSTAAQKAVRKITTSTIVANREVLAIGGLIRTNIANQMSKVPILGDIPLIGWLFKNKRKIETKEDLLMLISAHIIEPADTTTISKFTHHHINDYQGTLDTMRDISEKRDPIHKLFFEEVKTDAQKSADDFIFQRQKPTVSGIEVNPRDKFTLAENKTPVAPPVISAPEITNQKSFQVARRLPVASTKKTITDHLESDTQEGKA